MNMVCEQDPFADPPLGALRSGLLMPVPLPGEERGSDLLYWYGPDGRVLRVDHLGVGGGERILAMKSQQAIQSGEAA